MFLILYILNDIKLMMQCILGKMLVSHSISILIYLQVNVQLIKHLQAIHVFLSDQSEYLNTVECY